MKGKKNKSSLKQIKKMSLTRGTVYSARQNESWRLGYMTLEYEYRQRYEEGLKEGEETGIAKTNERFIRKLYKRGESIASIAEFVELDEETVKRIIEAMGLE
jgi:hypothetical protein